MDEPCGPCHSTVRLDFFQLCIHILHVVQLDLNMITHPQGKADGMCRSRLVFQIQQVDSSKV